MTRTMTRTMDRPTPTPKQSPKPAPRARSASFAVPLRLLAALLLLVGVVACGGGILGGGGSGPYERPDTDRITGEVERVEEYANEIDVWTAERRIVTIRYDDDTPVYYRGERFDPEALERGDVVTVQVERTSSGTWMAERIDVDQARQDRAGTEPGYDDEPSGDDEPWEDDDPWGEDEDERTVEGEIRSVDHDRRRLEIDTAHGPHALVYGSTTPVYFRGEEHDPRGLEPGDVIRAEVDTTREPWRVLDYITVTQSRQERAAGGGDDPWDDPADGEEGERFAGTVQQVDTRRGEFTLDTERYGLKTVVMPFNASRSDREAFDRLRRGDTVRIEGQRMSQDRIELLRFGW